MCWALGVMTYAGLPRFCAWAMIEAQTCSDEQLSINARPTPIRAAPGSRSEFREETEAANHCALTFIFCSLTPSAGFQYSGRVVSAHHFRDAARSGWKIRVVRVCGQA